MATSHLVRKDWKINANVLLQENEKKTAERKIIRKVASCKMRQKKKKKKNEGALGVEPRTS